MQNIFINNKTLNFIMFMIKWVAKRKVFIYSFFTSLPIFPLYDFSEKKKKTTKLTANSSSRDIKRKSKTRKKNFLIFA